MKKIRRWIQELRTPRASAPSKPLELAPSAPKPLNADELRAVVGGAGESTGSPVKGW